MDLEKYSFSRNDLVVAAAIDSYLRALTSEARREMMAGIVHRGDGETVIDGKGLAALIENAKAAAMISSEAWRPGEGDYQKSVEYIREQLPAVDGQKYVENMPERFARFIQDCAE